jgi:hypothetical protein
MTHTGGFAASNDGPQSWASMSPGVSLHCPLLTNFRDSLLVKGALLEQFVEADSDEERILAEVKHKFASLFPRRDNRSSEQKTEAWAQADRVELFLTLAIPKNLLYTVLQYRLLVAEKVGVKNIMCLNKLFQHLTANVNLRDYSSWSPEIESNLRFILIDIVRETQGEQLMKQLARRFLHKVTRQLLSAGLISCVLFMLPYVLLRASYFFSPMWSILVPIWVCLAAGLFGAYFSRLLYIQKTYTKLSYDELTSSLDPFAVLLRGSIGLCGAGLLFFLLLSGLLSGFVHGSLVPQATIHLEPPTDTASHNLALLFVWSFFAGFSERLVPNILATTERGLVSAESTNGHDVPWTKA